MRSVKIVLTAFMFVLIGAYVFRDNKVANEDVTTSAPVTKETYKYWKSNNAELSRFELNQLRYGEIHKGQAVMIFVTEPFLPVSQVKYDGIKTPEKKTEVLKLNFQKNFYTGIYPYSIMTSVFTPFVADPGFSYKVTTSSQDWCGQSFIQLNRLYSGYRARILSYFQSSGDKNLSVGHTLLEDEIWTKIRLNYKDLPIGEVRIIPSTQYLELMHADFRAYEAVAELLEVKDEEIYGGVFFDYKLSYKNLKREFHYYFEKSFPHRILGWEESYLPLSFTGIKEPMTTTARLAKTIRLDYWNKNREKDAELRKDFGLFEIN